MSSNKKKVKRWQHNEQQQEKSKVATTKWSGNKKTGDRQQNKAATKRLKRWQRNKAARKKAINRRQKIKRLQQNKFILQCNFIYLECLTFLFSSFFLALIIIYGLYIILEKCYFISMILRTIWKPKRNKFITTIIIIIIIIITIIITIIIIIIIIINPIIAQCFISLSYGNFSKRKVFWRVQGV